MSDLFKNKYRISSTRLAAWDYTAAGIYFITICTNHRVRWFGKIENGQMKLSAIGKIIKDEWIKTAQIRQNITLDEWIIMPDHIHGIIIINDKISNNQMIHAHDDQGDNKWKKINIKNGNQCKPNAETTRRVVSMPNDKNSNNQMIHAHDDQGDNKWEKINIKNGNQCKPNAETTRRVVSAKDSVAVRTLQSNSIGSIIGQFKSICTKRIWNMGFRSFRWQSRFHDRIIRDERELYIKRKYIRSNPINWHK